MKVDQLITCDLYAKNIVIVIILQNPATTILNARSEQLFKRLVGAIEKRNRSKGFSFRSLQNDMLCMHSVLYYRSHNGTMITLMFAIDQLHVLDVKV